jgi:hypothetical protein
LLFSGMVLLPPVQHHAREEQQQQSIPHKTTKSGVEKAKVVVVVHGHV